MDLPHLFTDYLSKGLAPEGSRIPVNAKFMEYMHNAKSMDVGVVFPEKVTAPATETIAYPYPQFFRGERGDFIFKQNQIKYRAGRSGAFSALSTWLADFPATAYAVDSEQLWQFVSKEKLWFASNGTQLYFKIPTYNFVVGTPLHVGALGQHGPRLLLGDVASTGESDWFASSRWQHVMEQWRQNQPKGDYANEDMVWDPSWIVYLEPGGGADDIPYHIGLAMLGVFGESQFDFWLPFIDTYIENGEIGLIPSKRNSAIYAIKELGDNARIIAYGRDAITELKPRENYRYEEEVLSEIGITGRGAVGGYLDSHVAVDSQYHLAVVRPEGGVDRINHAAKLTPGEGAGEYIVSCDELFGDFWITDGVQSWLFNGVLGGPVDVCPTGLVRDASGGLLGFALHQAESSYTFEIRFNPLDFWDRDWKKITTMMFEAVGLTDIAMRVDSRHAGDGDWFLGPWIPAFAKNYSTASKSGVELRVSFRGTTTHSDPARLSSLESRYAGMSGRTRRGPSPRTG